MSSILDALQRAETERQAREGTAATDASASALATDASALRAGDREAMAQALTTATAPELWSDLRTRATPAARQGLGRLMTALAVLGVMAAAAWTWQSLQPTAPEIGLAQIQPQPQPSALQAAEPTPPAVEPVPIRKDGQTKSSSKVVPSAPFIGSAPPARSAPSAPLTPAPREMPETRETRDSAHAGARVPSAQPVKPMAELEPAIRPVESLSPAERQALGPLNVQGVVHSAQSASRLLMINGLVLREGESLTPQLRLERIGPEGAQLHWQPPSGGPASASGADARAGQRFLLALPASSS
jgi:general secretion pathway protein B